MAASASTAHSAPALANLSGTILLAGAGKMGGAMLQGWLALGLSPENVAAIEPQPSPEVTALAARGLRLNPSRDAVGNVAAVVVAVKPQTAPEALPALAPFVDEGTVVVSIMAGRTLGVLADVFPRAALVRAMPNTPAAIGRGITVAVANPRVSPEQRVLVDALLSAVGAVEWISDETLMDAVTALSGSGPAYVFLLAEAMAHAGAAAGLPPALAATLARATVAGSGELLQRSPLDPATLRQNVTSPGGTTAAALDVLMGKDGLERLMTAAIAAATKRSRDLAG
jgi:pyrroline-5-carboxylate reductase